MKHIALYFIKLYKRYLAEGLNANCRYYPTCSEYAMICISDFGFVSGMPKSAWRILRCNPYAKGGEDKPKISKRKYRHFI